MYTYTQPSVDCVFFKFLASLSITTVTNLLLHQSSEEMMQERRKINDDKRIGSLRIGDTRKGTHRAHQACRTPTCAAPARDHFLLSKNQHRTLSSQATGSNDIRVAKRCTMTSGRVVWTFRMLTYRCNFLLGLNYEMPF